MHSDEMTTALAMLERALNRLSDTQIRLATAMEAAAGNAHARLAAFDREVLQPTVRATGSAEL